MIIVSQDKRLLTKSLELSIEDIENKDAKKIMVESNCGKLYFLGKYATEERAKEVLQEIIDMYGECNASCASTGYGYVRNKVYEMPED